MYVGDCFHVWDARDTTVVSFLNKCHTKFLHYFPLPHASVIHTVLHWVFLIKSQSCAGWYIRARVANFSSARATIEDHSFFFDRMQNMDAGPGARISDIAKESVLWIHENEEDEVWEDDEPVQKHHNCDNTRSSIDNAAQWQWGWNWKNLKRDRRTRKKRTFHFASNR